MSYARALYKSTLSGLTGPTGPAGSSSSSSGTGYTGPTGEKGYTGYTGSNGTSYTGPTGPMGYTGYTGSNGTSYTGPTGPMGYTGYTGSNGTSYTGPTGTSYWSINGSNIYYSSGNVGINDSTPSYALDVNGDGRFTGTLNASTFNTTSDYRIKESVKRIDENYTIDKLRPVIYINTQTSKTDMGLIAHELQESYPFLVNGEKDGKEKQSVNYIGLIALLIKEMQEFKKEIHHLKREIKKLQNLE